MGSRITQRISEAEKHIVSRQYSVALEQLAADHPTPSSGLQKRIRGLTISAEHFLLRGDVDNAFESLMRAYLLDPVAPEVVVCEKHVLPAWQKLRRKAVTGVRHEWKLKIATRQQPKMQSSLFDRLKSGKLFQ